MTLSALIVGSSPSRPSRESLRNLARGAGLIVAVDGGAEALAAADLLPDLFVGDMDSTSTALAQQLSQVGVEVIVHPAIKDVSDLHLALDECVRRSVNRITAVGVSGGRLDHELSALGVIATYGRLRPEVISDDEAIYVLAEDGRRELILAGEGKTFSVMALREKATVSVNGALWPLRQAVLEPLSDHGLSNIISSGPARVVLETGVALVLTPGTPDERASRATRCV